MKFNLNVILGLLFVLCFQITNAQKKTITGTVSDSSESLPGVVVIIKGTSVGTETDFGIGCTVTSSEDDWEADADNLGFRRIRGTFTAPQYLEWQNPPSKFIRDAN